MEYKGFDNWKIESDELLEKIYNKLRIRPMTANELDLELLGDPGCLYDISRRLQKLKAKGRIINRKRSCQCYWGVRKEDRLHVPVGNTNK